MIEKLKKARTDSDVLEIVWEAFRDLFMDGVDGDDYRESAFDIWKKFAR